MGHEKILTKEKYKKFTKLSKKKNIFNTNE
jgi:hypothetical protein